jgi:hypothetical protein
MLELLGTGGVGEDDVIAGGAGYSSAVGRGFEERVGKRDENGKVVLTGIDCVGDFVVINGYGFSISVATVKPGSIGGFSLEYIIGYEDAGNDLKKQDKGEDGSGEALAGGTMGNTMQNTPPLPEGRGRNAEYVS